MKLLEPTIASLNLKADVNLSNEYDPQKHSPFLNALERRAFGLRLAAESIARDVTFREDTSEEKTNQILQMAKAFDDYIVGGNNV